MEIEVKDYVRTPIGIFIISHINIDFDDNDKNKCLLCQNEKVLFLSIETIKSLKHSKQLIDLIEVGDIVNKELIIGIIDITNDKEEIIGKKLITQYRSAQFTGLDIKHYIYANDIKTILIKESYMANCYKVGGEDE